MSWLSPPSRTSATTPTISVIDPGVSDVSPWTSLAVVGCSLVVVCSLCLMLLRRGYKIRH